MKKAVLFDMDGTVLDTIEDLYDSMNFILRQYSCPERSVEEIRSFVGNGIRKLVERAAPEGTPQDRIEAMFRDMIRHYRAHCQVKTKPYEGIPELLQALKDRGIRTAVVSNKADPAAQELARSQFDGAFDFVLGAKDGVRLKPDREMLDIALKALGAGADEAVYVGDSQVDIETAHNAGMDCVSVTWGFRTREALAAFGAQFLADSPEEVLVRVLEG